MEYNSNMLIPDILFEISKHLNFRNCKKCSQVSKTWYNVFSKKSEYSILLKNQIKHYENFKFHMKKYRRVIDTSMMGYGKTYIACNFVSYIGYDIFLICNKILYENWDNVANIFNVNIKYRTTYNLLGKGKYIDREKLKLTNEFKKLINSGDNIFIFEESSSLKNKTYKTYVSLILLRYLYKHKKYVIFLSATPLDNISQMYNIIRTLGIVDENNFKYIWKHKKIKTIIKENNNILVSNNLIEMVYKELNIRIPSANAEQKIINIFKNYIKQKYFINMDSYNSGVKFDIKNIIYTDGSNYTDISSEISNLQLDEDNRLGNFSKILYLTEKIKINIFYNYLYHKDFSKKYKFVCVLNYKKNIDKLYEMCNKDETLVICGNTNYESRISNINNFNNNKNIRILILSLRACSYGISLHDKIGNSPRFMLISPSFYTSDIFQMTRRIYRNETKSDAIVRLIYCTFNDIDGNMLRSTTKKGELLKMCSNYSNGDVIYPNNIETINDGEDIID